MDDKTKKLLNTKLRQPVHISYISKYILKITEKEAKEILDKLIDEGVIEESPLAPGYYGNK
jgi:predicted ArsR family transcriptional regulator